MGRKLGSPVLPCPAGDSGQEGIGQPLDPAKHQNCAIKILSIKEKDNDVGPEFKDGGAEIFVKGLSNDLVIRYEVKVCTMSVTLWIEFDAGNQVHTGFYKTYEGKGVTAPRVVVVVAGTSMVPGIHETLWDGRDKTPDHRILLDGTYKVRIQGLHDVTRDDTTTIKIMPPVAHNYGIHYPGNTTKKEVEHAAAQQKALPDGTAFVSDASVAATAADAWTSFGGAAIGVVSGHSNPSMLAFYPEASAPGKAATYAKKKESYILTLNRPNPPPAKPKADIDNSVFVSEQPANALRDMFLMILAGCRASNEVLLVQRRLRELSKAFDPKGIDGKHGPHTTAALQAWQQWEHIDPADGTKNDATLTQLDIDATLSEKEQTTQVQKALTDFSRRYNPGEEDGVWGTHTEEAITNYQQDHSPPLDVTSLPDKPTLQHLHPTGTLEGQAHNIAESFTVLGANLVLGFVKKVSFNDAEKWHINFWDQVAAGSGVDDAATEARNLCGALASKGLDYVLYARDGVDKNSTVHPARYGKDMV